jgi:hypothetical protein
MERFKASIEGKDFALCNMDVKSCFDNVNLKHPNFLNRLELGLGRIENLVSKEAAQFLRFIFKDYLHANLVLHKKFHFKKSKAKNASSIHLPKEGTLPTGFVLSPALWLTLALPAVLETEKRRAEGKLFSYDLCGDDLMALAPRGLPEEDKEKICEPWFALAKDLDLRFHFFKNYKDKRVYYHEKWKFLFDGRLEQHFRSAWVNKFPAYSIPVFHAGTVLARKSFVETITSLDPTKLESKLYCALSKRNREGTANFVPRNAVEALKGFPTLVNRLVGTQAAKRLSDRVEERQEKKQFLTGSQSFVGSMMVSTREGRASGRFPDG